MPDMEFYQIGLWRFSVSDGVLRGPSGERRLEDRAARMLTMLCRRQGEVISQQEILDEIWDGRVVSGNSVAVVISDLRRALDEDARAPAHVETLPKRGYRLRPQPGVDEDAGEDPADGEPVGVAFLHGRRWAIAFGCAAVLTTVAVGIGGFRRDDLQIDVGAVQNDTGRADLDRLGRALGDLVEFRLAAIPGVSLTEQIGQGAEALQFRSRLYLWNGQPTLSLQAIRTSDGMIVWTGMADGPESALAANTVAQLKRFAEVAGRWAART